MCTWSMGNDFDKIRTLREITQLNHLHLDLNPALNSDADYVQRVTQQGWEISATMVSFPQEDYTSLDTIKATGGIVPDDCWGANKKRVLDSIAITADLGVKYLTMHFGFINPADAKGTAKLADKMKLLADDAAKNNVQLLMETGQETAEQLAQFLKILDHPAVGVNIDPGNMILYQKGSPDEAVRTLAGWIKHVHIKDATKPETPGQWGKEVAWGDGQVGSDEFLIALKQINYTGALAIEREAGEDPLSDLIESVNILTSFSA